MAYRVCLVLITLVLMTGCTATVPPPPEGHPANPDALGAPAPNPSSTLQTDDPVKPPEISSDGGHGHGMKGAGHTREESEVGR
jgi:hypothetical protein